MENFPFISEFYSEGAAYEVTEERLAAKVRELLISPETAQQAGRKARQLYERSSGGVDRAMAMIAGVMGDI